MNGKSGFSLLLGVTLLLAAAQAHAAELMPDFSAVPLGWSTDRYAPDSFANVGTYQGRSNVLGIGIGPNGATSNRPSGNQANFYSTQGMGYAISGGAGDSISAALFVPQSWSDPTQGARRTDMWGVMNGGADYPIIGFTNDGTGIGDQNSSGGFDNFIGFRIYSGALNSGGGGWIDLANAVDYGGWNTLSIGFDGSNYDYLVNGILADVVPAGGASTISPRSLCRPSTLMGTPTSRVP